MKNEITGSSSITIDAPASTVWDALTNPKTIKQYFFDTNAKSDWRIGSPITFEGEWEGKSYQDKGTVLSNKINKSLSYSYWSSMSGIEDKPENYATITYSLSENHGKTKLTVTQENIPTKEMKAHSEQNWKKVLTKLKEVVEAQAVHA